MLIRRWLARGAVILLIALAADAAFVAYGLRASLLDASACLQHGADALSAGRVREARQEFSEALDEARSAESLTKHPAFLTASLVPPIEADSGAIEALAEAAGLSARAGYAAATGVTRTTGGGGDLTEAVYRSARVRFETVDEAQPYLSEVRRLLDDAARGVEAAPQPTLNPLVEALAEARSRVAAARNSVAYASTLLDALPSLLASDSSRRYFLAMQTPSETRGTGGLIGFYGILRAHDGRLSLEKMAPIRTLIQRPLGHIEAPRWFESRYRSMFSLRQWQQANISPHFPVVSQVLLDMYESATGDRLDGVLAMDPIALGLFTAATGPLQGDGLETEIGPETAAQVLLHDSYVGFEKDPSAQDRYLMSVTRSFWERFETGSFDVRTLAASMSEAVRGGHLKAYVDDASDQKALDELDATGDLSGDGPNLQLVYHNNFGANKVDYFLKRSIDTVVRLDEQGDAVVRTKTTLENTAPAGPPSPLLGSGNYSAPVGTNRMVLSLLMPEASEVKSLKVNGDSKDVWVDRELAYPVIAEVMDIPPGEDARVTLVYRVTDAASLSIDGGSFAMTLLPQATVRPDHFSFTVVPPYGFEGRSTLGNEVLGDGPVELEGLLDEKKTLRMELSRA